jgi:hypothetical protein
MFSQLLYAKDCLSRHTWAETLENPIFVHENRRIWQSYSVLLGATSARNYAGKLERSAFEPQSTTPTLSPGRGL